MIPGSVQCVPGISHSELIYTMVIPYLSLTYSVGQDTVLLVQPYPYVLEDPADVPLDDCWIARPQLYFTCHLRPANGRQPKARRTYGEDDIPVELVFFSTFEELALSGSDPMKSHGAHPLCGQHRKCAGTCAVDAPVSPWQLYPNHPTPAP